MGTDIHMRAEVRKDGKWEVVGKVFQDPYYDPNDAYFKAECFRHTAEPYGSRNYNLFAILANVRNGYGFAGVETGTGFNVIAQPRGIPKDASPEVKEIANGQGKEWLGDHTYSHLTLKELLNFDGNQSTKQYGIIEVNEYKTHRKGTPPEGGYCGGVMGAGINVVLESEAEKLTSLRGVTHVRVEWKQTYRAAVGDFWFNTTLKKLQELGKPEDVRIVFGFDS